MRDGDNALRAWQKMRIELIVWCAIREEGPQDADLRRVSDWGVVERVNDGGDAENV